MPLGLIITLAVLGGLAIVFGALYAILAVVRRAVPGVDLAPEWWLRCTACGRGRTLNELGGVRLGARGTRMTHGYCRGCGKFRKVQVIHERDLTPAQIDSLIEHASNGRAEAAKVADAASRRA